MSTSRKPPSAAFWATVVVVVVVLAALTYPLSMGPYCWLRQQIHVPKSIESAMNDFYHPVWKACWNGPEWLAAPMRSYLGWCGGEELPPRLGR